MVQLSKIQREMVSSALTIVLAVLAISVFIVFGGSVLFYALMLLAIGVGFYNAWLISKEGERGRARRSRRR